MSGADGSPRRRLPRNIARVQHFNAAGGQNPRVCERFGVTVKVFRKQLRIGSRFADIDSAQKVAETFHQLAVKVGSYA